MKRAPAPLIQVHLVPVCPQYGRQLVHRFRDLNGALGHRECRIPYDEAANKAAGELVDRIAAKPAIGKARIFATEEISLQAAAFWVQDPRLKQNREKRWL